jgi:hypothetical protein
MTVEDKETEFRQVIKTALMDLFQSPGTFIRPRMVAAFCNVSHMRLYRLVWNRVFLPSVELCHKIAAFLKLASQTRETWLTLISVWDKHDLADVLPPAVMYEFFDRRLYDHLASEKLTKDEKLNSLTALTLRLIVKRLVAERGDEVEDEEET